MKIDEVAFLANEAGKYYTDLRDLDMDIDEAIAAAPKPGEGA